MKISKAILREMGACPSGLRDFIWAHGGNEITLSECVDSGSNSVSDYLWFIAKQNLSDSQIKDVKLFAVWCAKSCADVFNRKYPDDSRVNDAISAAENAINDPTGGKGSAAGAAYAAQRVELKRIVTAWGW